MLILTKFLRPTNSRGSRIKATCPHLGVSVTVSYNHALSSGGDEDSNHMAAAQALVTKLSLEVGALGAPTLIGYAPDGYAYDTRPGHLATEPAIVLSPADVTAQSIRATQKFLDTRGPGEVLTDTYGAIVDALLAGREVEVRIRKS